jgi:fatty acid/phospholipid biosynthesis enzyme
MLTGTFTIRENLSSIRKLIKDRRHAALADVDNQLLCGAAIAVPIPDVLYQYGFIGTIYSKLVNGIEELKVALLNFD